MKARWMKCCGGLAVLLLSAGCTQPIRGGDYHGQFPRAPTLTLGGAGSDSVDSVLWEMQAHFNRTRAWRSRLSTSDGPTAERSWQVIAAAMEVATYTPRATELEDMANGLTPPTAGRVGFATAIARGHHSGGGFFTAYALEHVLVISEVDATVYPFGPGAAGVRVERGFQMLRRVCNAGTVELQSVPIDTVITLSIDSSAPPVEGRAGALFAQSCAPAPSLDLGTQVIACCWRI